MHVIKIILKTSATLRNGIGVYRSTPDNGRALTAN